MSNKASNENETQNESSEKLISELKDTIVHLEKLATIGQMTAGIAHELNNPIFFISNNIQALVQYMDTILALPIIVPEEKKEDIEFIKQDVPGLLSETQEGLKRVLEIVKGLKEFSRKDGNEKSPHDINEAIKNTLIIAKNEYKYVSDIELHLGQIPEINVNYGEISQVFLNIIVNAAQAIASMNLRDKKTIRITTYQKQNYVWCEIEDEGPGIPHEILNKIFEPFFTTKAKDKGTGLGLPIAKEIIEIKHQGKIEVSSQMGKGTKISILLPIG